MKKFSLFLLVIFLISVSSSFQQVAAQEKSKTVLDDKEQKLKLEIEQQKKVMSDQKKAQTEAEADAKDQWKRIRIEAEKWR